MSDQAVIYSTLIHHQSPSESPNRVRTQNPGNSDDKEFSVPWRLIALTLGILCFLLLMTITVLGTMIFQYVQERRHQQDEILQNLTKNGHIMQNNSTKQLLTNETSACGILKNKTLQQIKKPVCHRKKMISSKSLQNTGEHDEEHWSCCGVSCYLFINEDKDWKGCNQTCQSSGLSLLKIDDEDELAFLQPQTHDNTYWIGLSHNEKKQKWEWTGNGTPGMNSSIMRTTSGRGQCAFLTSTRVVPIDCSNTYKCICEQSIFPALRGGKKNINIYNNN